MTIQQLALEYSKAFETARRSDGSEFIRVSQSYKDSIGNIDAYQKSPLYLLIQRAHAGMFPDDWKYEFILDSLSEIAECDSDEDVGKIQFYDTYSSYSNTQRFNYCDDALTEGEHKYIHDIILDGLDMEKTEVLEIVISELENILASSEVQS
jgi:hypothetical protein